MLIVTQLDRLAHSTRDLLITFCNKIGEKGAAFKGLDKSLADAWAYTTTPRGEQMISGNGTG